MAETPVFVFCARDGEWFHFNAVLPDHDEDREGRSFKVDADEFAAGWALLAGQVETWLGEE